MSKRYAITVYMEGPKAASVFDLLARMPIFATLAELAAKAGYRVTGYEAKPLEKKGL